VGQVAAEPPTPCSAEVHSLDVVGRYERNEPRNGFERSYCVGRVQDRLRSGQETEAPEDPMPTSGAWVRRHESHIYANAHAKETSGYRASLKLTKGPV